MSYTVQIAEGLLIPFIGTSLGALCVLFMKEMNLPLRRAFTGFAAGIMTAAAIWSLLIPSIEQSEEMGTFSFVPAVVGFMAGILFLLLLDSVTPHMHIGSKKTEGLRSGLRKTTMMVFAVALHNIPEGIDVGVVYAGLVTGVKGITVLSALSLAIGIALQNFPEGAIVSMLLRAEGVSKKNAILLGILSGAVEPVAALITVLLSGVIVPFMPYLLSFAAGAMFYVVVEELIPDMSEGEHSNLSTLLFAVGFCIMLILDGTLG
ncbi:MAG: ZIP family metal transporter [Lachnospiraceae bacterium]|nr:ZIP family metal transporter [Lachnospiraceae bacterium]